MTDDESLVTYEWRTIDDDKHVRHGEDHQFDKFYSI